MDTYNSIKQRLGKENDITTRGHRIASIKIRISNHRLGLETGSFLKNKIQRK